MRVFVSYSHDSPEHAHRVRDFADRLVNEGIDCHLDQYERFPSEGWPLWMQRQIRDADYVLCMASEAYYRRVTGVEAAKVGGGAKWEGGIINQVLYESEGSNEKFIPVYFGSANAKFIPPFLGPFTRYDVADADGYERLYRLLTDQPAIVKPPLGQLREYPKGSELEHDLIEGTGSDFGDHSSMALVFAPDLGMHFVIAEALDLGDTVELTARAYNPDGANFLASLARSTKPVGISHGLIAFQATVGAVRQSVRGSIQQFQVSLHPDQSDYGGGLFEMSLQGLSADRIAELRARRILLDERLAENHSSDISMLNDATLEVFVRGINAPLSVEESPLPDVFSEIGENPSFFIAGARLVAILWLRMSGTVETVSKCDMQLSEPGVLSVDFAGQRSRKYVNADPARIAVRGQCALVRG